MCVVISTSPPLDFITFLLFWPLNSWPPAALGLESVDWARRLGFALGRCIDGAVMPWARVLSWLCALSKGQQGEVPCPGPAFASTLYSLGEEKPLFPGKQPPHLHSLLPAACIMLQKSACT